MNKQQLATKIWASANKMRSKIEANEYKDYILGFIFYKYLSDKLESFFKAEGWSEEDLKDLSDGDTDVIEDCQKKFGYYIEYKNFFSTWINSRENFDVSNVRDALSAFDRYISPTHKLLYSNILETLQTGLGKLGESSGAQTKAIRDLLILIKEIPTNSSQDYDVLGFIYEYLISSFAANAGKKAGEFYTPHEVSVLMSDIIANHLQNREHIKIYDPTSGSGSLLINIGNSVAKHIDSKDNIKYYAQELKANTFNLTRMNLIMRDIDPANIAVRNADTLEDDWPYFDDNDKERTYQHLQVDAVVSNPPYSQEWEPTGKDNDPRYADFGLAPKSKADYAFLLHDLYHVRPDGIMTIVLPHGVLFRGGEEEAIRTNLVEKNHIDAIIGLPANIFFGTGIPTIVLVLRQKREHTDTLFVDASKGFVKDGKNNKLRACDIKKIVDAVISRSELPKFSRRVSRDEIRNNDYNLNIPRYVDSSADAESWDIYATMFGGVPNSEIDAYKEYWEALPTLRSAIFKSDETPYSSLVSSDVKSIVVSNKEVLQYVSNYQSQFDDFEEYLRAELLEGMMSVKVGQEEHRISDEIFSRLSSVALVDKYAAYQILDDNWQHTATDLEIIQTEGFESTHVVDPNMVIKKKDNKEVEVQEGWKGRVIPFELVQSTLLKEEAEALRSKENDLAAVIAEREEILDSLTEEEKESAICNDAKDAFVAKELTKKIKDFKGTKLADEKELLEKLVRADKLIKDEKSLKKTIKDDTLKLHLLTKETIESLPEKDTMMLLEMKWITPLYRALTTQPDTIFRTFISNIETLVAKYATTMLDIENSIKESENSLSALIDELEGNEFDMAGLREFQNLLNSGADE
ncbi:MAG: type I restriction-modification system subunit M [Rikenellaceae bacterium]